MNLSWTVFFGWLASTCVHYVRVKSATSTASFSCLFTTVLKMPMSVSFFSTKAYWVIAPESTHALKFPGRTHVDITLRFIQIYLRVRLYTVLDKFMIRFLFSQRYSSHCLKLESQRCQYQPKKTGQIRSDPSGLLKNIKNKLENRVMNALFVSLSSWFVVSDEACYSMLIFSFVSLFWVETGYFYCPLDLSYCLSLFGICIRSNIVIM